MLKYSKLTKVIIMRHLILGFCVIAAVVGMALYSAQTKVHDYSSLADLRVGLQSNQLSFLGQPISSTDRERVYLLPDQSTLIVMLQDQKVTAAWMQLRQPLKIEDPQFKRLRFVQMGMDEALSPTWFYAAAADQGRIFKISQQGLIESITWVKPFSANETPKNLQALMQQFNGQRPYSL